MYFLVIFDAKILRVNTEIFFIFLFCRSPTAEKDPSGDTNQKKSLCPNLMRFDWNDIANVV